ncbi:hypothetical protein FQN54_005335 [Arachnomyces sp. PD_36]|nr:hypothetical protein FQN54_005335 [Arachnomyces sp. PD_36]
MSSKASRSIVASPKVLALLERLHAASSAQESSFSVATFFFRKYISSFFTRQPWSSQDDNFMRDKFIALEADKSEFLYLLTQANRSLNIVEAGTSFGVSTIYLALSVGQNIAAAKSSPSTDELKAGKVIATEKEPSKAAKAREHWKEAGEEVEPYITLLEGDLLETLPGELAITGPIDLLLLDIWTPLALPTLKTVQKHLRRGALVAADNTVMSKRRYQEYLDYLYDPKNGFKSVSTPYKGGFELAVYLPSKE